MKNYTDLTLIVDRSGSMSRIARDMEGGFATFLKQEKESGDKTNISIVYFDDHIDQDVTSADIKDIDGIKIVPRGSTALLDAVGQTIAKTGERLSAMAEEDRPNRVLIYIITDGQENASHEYTLAQIRENITHQREHYAWDFVFLGANIDSFSVGGGMGIVGAATANFMATSAGVADLWSSNSEAFTMYKSLDRTVDRASTYSVEVDKNTK